MNAPASSSWIPVLEVGGTHVTSARVDAGSLRVEPGSARRRDLTESAGADELLEVLAAAADSVAAGHNRHWGVAMPGPFDYANGIAWYRGVGKFDALHGVDVGAGLRSRIDPTPIRLDFLNDADAFVLGEWAVGALAGTTRCAGFTLGTGIGSGFIVDGRAVHDGPGVPPDGEAHEIRVEGVPLEDLMSRRAIRRDYGRRTGAGSESVLDVAQIAALARTGETDAVAVLAAALRALGAALGPYLARFEPERVVVGGSMSASWTLFEPWFAEGCAQAGVAAPITVVALDPAHAGLSGAAAHARSVRTE